jgi:hypothetical protein
MDFFNRLKSVIVHPDGKKELISFHDLKKYTDAQVFHPSVSNMNELRTKWLIPVLELT